MSKFLHINHSGKMSGVTMIEVIFSVALIGFILVIYAASLNLAPLIKSTRHQNVAYHLALKYVEQLRNTEFSALPASGSLTDADLSLLPAGAAQLTISDEAVGLKRITVTVSWLEGSGSESASLDTLIFENGLNTL